MRVRSLKCPHCGGRARINHGENQALCIHCGQLVRLSDAVLQEQATAARFPPTTPLKLGMKANYGGKEYEAAGRQVMQQQDDEGVYTWEEWVLIAPDGDLIYLEFDEGKWKMSRGFTPSQPLGPDQLRLFHAGSALPIGERGALVTDSGTCRLVHAEGEFPYVTVPNRVVGFLDAAARDRFYSVEWTEDAVECYEGRFMDARQVYVMFGLHQLVQAEDRRQRVLASRKRFGGLCIGLSVISFIAWLYALNSGAPVTKGSGSIPLSQATGEGVRFGPIQLAGAGRIYRLQLSGSMREESNWVQAILEDDQEQELFSSERDMWDESGYDDGYWHESDLNASRDFIVKKPGKYFVRIFSEPEPGRTPSGNASASFMLKEKVVHPPYLAYFGIAAFVLGLGFVMAGSPSTVQKLRESAESDD
ncbi:MAG: DUF4178 domain-containing protein [Actinomycetota bacterium]